MTKQEVLDQSVKNGNISMDELLKANYTKKAFIADCYKAGYEAKYNGRQRRFRIYTR